MSHLYELISVTGAYECLFFIAGTLFGSAAWWGCYYLHERRVYVERPMPPVRDDVPPPDAG